MNHFPFVCWTPGNCCTAQNLVSLSAIYVFDAANDISFQSNIVRARTRSHRLSRINPAKAFFSRLAFPNIFMAIANIDASSKLSCLPVSLALVMSFIGNQAPLESTTISAINSQLNLPLKYNNNNYNVLHLIQRLFHKKQLYRL